VARSHQRLGLQHLNQANNLADSRPWEWAGDQRQPANRPGQHTVVTPSDLATAHRMSDQVVQRLDAHCGPLRCTVHLEPHDPASAMLIQGAGDG
jgi:hypothetical protein